MKRTVIANLESGRRAALSIAELLAIADILGVPPIALLYPPSEAAGEVEYVPGETDTNFEAMMRFTGRFPPKALEQIDHEDPRQALEEQIGLLLQTWDQIQNCYASLDDADEAHEAASSTGENVDLFLSMPEGNEADNKRRSEFLVSLEDRLGRDALRKFYTLISSNAKVQREILILSNLLQQLETAGVKPHPFQFEFENLSERLTELGGPK